MGRWACEIRYPAFALLRTGRQKTDDKRYKACELPNLHSKLFTLYHHLALGTRHSLIQHLSSANNAIIVL